MQNIIVPIDFSKHANNALQFAINIANHFEAKIHLIHVYKVQSKTGMFRTVRDFMKNDAEEELSNIVKKIKNSLFRNTSLEARAVEGYPADIITRFAESVNADLIVMGTQGATGLKEIFIGSNTVGVIKKGKTPLLAIPNGFKYRSFKKITLAVDHNIVTTSEVLRPLAALSAAYNAHVNIVHIEHPAEQIAIIDPGVEVYLSAIPHSFHFVGNEDVNEGINEFVKKSDSEILCMIKRDLGFFGNLFHSSVTSKEAFHSPVPLLVLYEK